MKYFIEKYSFFYFSIIKFLYLNCTANRTNLYIFSQRLCYNTIDFTCIIRERYLKFLLIKKFTLPLVDFYVRIVINS